MATTEDREFFANANCMIFEYTYELPDLPENNQGEEWEEDELHLGQEEVTEITKDSCYSLLLGEVTREQLEAVLNAMDEAENDQGYFTE